MRTHIPSNFPVQLPTMVEVAQCCDCAGGIGGGGHGGSSLGDLCASIASSMAAAAKVATSKSASMILSWGAANAAGTPTQQEQSGANPCLSHTHVTQCISTRPSLPRGAYPRVRADTRACMAVRTRARAAVRPAVVLVVGDVACWRPSLQRNIHDHEPCADPPKFIPNRNGITLRMTSWPNSFPSPMRSRAGLY